MKSLPANDALAALLYACFVSQNPETGSRVVDLVEAVKAEHEAAAPDQHFSIWAEREIAIVYYREKLAALKDPDTSYLRAAGCEAVAALLDQIQPWKNGSTYWLEFGGDDEDSVDHG